MTTKTDIDLSDDRDDHTVVEIDLDESNVEQLPLQLSIAGFDPEPIIRPEYNIGKFAGIIFTSPYAKNVWEPRSHEWHLKRGDQKVAASLTVRPLHGRKTPTTTTLRVYLALLQIWTHCNKPADGVITFSFRQLAEIIGWRWGGAETAQRIAEHLDVLHGTSLTWVLSFEQPDGTRERKKSDMHILDSAEHIERASLFKEEKFISVQRVRLSKELVDNMLAGHVRPMNYTALRAIANDTTLNLYTRLDIYLSKKPRWERRSKELFTEELGIHSMRYGKRFARKAKLKQLVADLDGVALVGGRLKVWIEETSDGLDDKIVAVRQTVLGAGAKRPGLKELYQLDEATSLAEDLHADLQRHPGGRRTKIGFLTFLCRHYPHDYIRKAASIAKADYAKYDVSIGAVFTHELEILVKADPALTWYRHQPKQPPVPKMAQ